MFVRVLLIVVAITVAALVAIGAYNGLKNQCSEPTSTQAQEGQQVVSDIDAEGGKNRQRPSEQKKNRADHFFAELLVPLGALEAIEEHEHSEESAQRAGNEPRDWGRSFLCDVKATDFAIAWFTLFLVVIGAWQGYALYLAVSAAQTSADALTQAERAHIFITIISQKFSDVLSKLSEHAPTPDHRITTPIVVKFSFKNHGKTPAIIKEISRELILRSAFPDRIDYISVDLVPVERILSSDAETETWPLVRNDFVARDARLVIGAQRPFWFYGRIVYDDVFGKEHEHRFIYRYNGSRGWRVFSHPEYSKNI